MNSTNRSESWLYTAVGRKIRETRMQGPLTQSDLAQAIGLTRTSVTNIEKGRQKIALHTLFEIATALGIQPSELIPQRPQFSEAAAGAKVPQTVGEKARVAIESAIIKSKLGK